MITFFKAKVIFLFLPLIFFGHSYPVPHPHFPRTDPHPHLPKQNNPHPHLPKQNNEYYQNLGVTDVKLKSHFLGVKVKNFDRELQDYLTLNYKDEFSN